MGMHFELNDSSANHSGEIGTTEDPNFKFWFDYYARQGELLYYYGFPIFLFIGLVGNIISIILITRQPFRSMSSGVYLLFLAVADLSICALGIADWLPEATMGYLISNHEAVCKTSEYFSKVLEQTSSWMIVALTVERAAIVMRPRKALLITTRKMAWMISAVVITVLMLINIRQPFIVGIVENGQCFFIKQVNNHLGGIALALLDLLIYSFIPSIVLIICNVALAVKLKQQRKDCLIEESEESVNKYKKQIIAMVITLSVVFVVLTLPYSCFVISDFVPPDMLWTPTTRELWFYIVSLLVTVNHSINIFLYFLMFRQEFWNIFKCCNCSRDTTTKDNVSDGHCSVSTVM